MKGKKLTEVNRFTNGVKIKGRDSLPNGLECEPMLKVGTSHSGPCTPGFVNKKWGSEHIYQNSDNYCMKVLTIEQGKSCSMHFHLEKHETMLVVEGVLAIDYIHDKNHRTHIVNQWEAFTICPGLPHSLRAPEGRVRLIEASTPDYKSDSIRIG